MNIYQFLKQKYYYWKIKREIPIKTVSKKKFSNMKDGGSISPELAYKIMHGDPGAIAELRKR